MKQIENIFTKIENKIKTPNPKHSIIIDTREKMSLVASYLAEKNTNIKFEKLEIADYLINEGKIAVERKTFSDFVSSMLNKRLLIQIKQLKKYPKQILILENFNYEYSDFNVHENAIRGMLLSCITDFEVPIIFTKDEEDTADFLILLAKKFEKSKQPISIRPSKSNLTKKQKKQFILEGFPGISPTIAKNLLKQFPTLKEIFNAPQEELSKIKKFHENKINKFRSILD